MISLNRSEIDALIDYLSAANAIEDAYRAVSLGTVNLPPVGHITFPEFEADCHIKFGHIQNDSNFVIKVATGFPNNAVVGHPTGNGLSIVVSAQTGAVKAILHDEMMLTDIRTGIGGAIATRLFARAESQRILIVGSGIQATRQIEAHNRLLSPNTTFEIWARSPEKAEQIADRFSDIVNVSAVGDLEKACRAADVIVTCTGATRPVIKRDWIQSGTHISAIGADAPGKQELETTLVTDADGLFADLSQQSLDHGEFSTASKKQLIDKSQVKSFGEVLLDPRLGRQADDDITIADLTGLAAQDIVMANIVLSAHEARSQPD